jgi:hypothetical protein
LAEISGEIEEIWKFNGQLGVKLEKSKTNDQNEKEVEIQGWNWSSLGGKLNKIETLKPIRGLIERNKKLKD